MKNRVLLGFLVPFAAFSKSVSAIEVSDYFSLNGLVGAYQTNGGFLTEGSKDGYPIEAKVRANAQMSIPVGDTWRVFGRMEYDLNFLDLKESTEVKNGALRKRYEYIGVEHEEIGSLWFGKDWGANYSHLAILKMRYLGFQDVAAAQGTWRNSDTLLYKNQFGDFTLVASTQLSDSTQSFDYEDDAFTTDGNAVSILYGASPFFGDGFGMGYSYHDAGLYAGNVAFGGQLYKDQGDATHNIGAHYRLGQWYLGATVTKTDLNNHGRNLELNDYTYDIAGEYTLNPDLKFIVHHAQVYGNYGQENERFIGYGTHYNITKNMVTFLEGRFSDGGESGSIGDTHVIGFEYIY